MSIIDFYNAAVQKRHDDELAAAPPPPPPPPPPVSYELDNFPPTPLPCVGMAVSRATLYVDGISPSDVRQGHVADCTLQAVLASFARSTEGQRFIHDKIQVLKDSCGSETYCVRLYEKNAAGGRDPVTIRVKECELAEPGLMKFSVDPATGKAEVWPRVIEAAMLQMNSRPCGTVLEAYGLLTGGVATDMSTSDPHFERSLILGFRTSQIQTLCTTGAFDHELSTPTTLKPNHAYTVVDVCDKDGKTWVTLRNPWGWDHPAPLPLDEVKKYFPVFSQGSVH